MLKITKNGIIQNEYITEFLANTYDKNVYIEPDKSCWIRLFHHNNPASVKFASTDTFATKVYKDADRWFNISLCNRLSNSWELMIKQKTTSSATETKYRWIQYYNPMTATFADVDLADVTINTSSGYSTVSNYGGIYYKNSSTYLCVNNAVSNNWMGAIGCWTAWGNGIPGWGTTAITTGYLDLYLRIDRSSDLTSIMQDILISPEIIEI